MASVCRPAVITTARSILFGSGTALPKSFLSRRAAIIVSRPLSSALGGLDSARPLHNAIASARLISNLAVDASCWSWLSQDQRDPYTNLASCLFCARYLDFAVPR